MQKKLELVGWMMDGWRVFTKFQMKTAIGSSQNNCQKETCVSVDLIWQCACFVGEGEGLVEERLAK